ncbi:hypothetical protein [Desulfofundulus kuznetsovii]
MIIDEVKSAIQKRGKYVTVAQMFASVALNLRKKGIRIRGKKAGGMDTIRKIWHDYCLKDRYWAHTYSKIVTEAKTFVGLHNDPEVLVLKERVREMLAPLKNITTEDILVAIVETGLSEKVIAKIRKELRRTKSNAETCDRHDSEDSFGKAATTIEKEIRYLKEKVQHLEANMLFIRETVQDISIATTGLETYKAIVDVIQQQQVFRRLEELEEKFKEVDYFNKKFSQLEEILPGIINKSNQIDEVSARLAALEQAYEKVSGALNGVEVVVRELHRVWSQNRTSSDRPVRCLSVHKDDTSPFHNAGMI